jgi:hypothetical protein
MWPVQQLIPKSLLPDHHYRVFLDTHPKVDRAFEEVPCDLSKGRIRLNGGR